MSKYYKIDKKTNFSNIILILTLLFLFLPLFVVIIFSFNTGQNSSSWQGFGFKWYAKLFFESADLWAAVSKSFIIAISSALLSTLIGSLAAIGISRYNFKGQKYIETLTYLPMVLPEVIIGISTLIFFSALKIRLGLFTIFLAHTTFSLPISYLIVKDSVDKIDKYVMEAARDLGCTEKEAMKMVLIPSIIPAIFSSILLTITLSLEDFIITFFVSGPGSTTLPIYIFSMIRHGISPVINSLTFLIVMVILLITISLRKFLKGIASRS